MSIVMNVAPFVDMTLLKRILETSISSGAEATLPGQSNRFPLTINLVLLSSFFYGCMLQMNCSYATSFLRLFVMFLLLMNFIVLVGFLMRLPTPFYRRLISFADDVHQSFFVLWVSH